MPRDRKGRFVKLNVPEINLEKAQLLSAEAHPVIGRIERWQMSDGSVVRIEIAPEAAK